MTAMNVPASLADIEALVAQKLPSFRTTAVFSADLAGVTLRGATLDARVTDPRRLRDAA